MAKTRVQDKPGATSGSRDVPSQPAGSIGAIRSAGGISSVATAAPQQDLSTIAPTASASQLEQFKANFGNQTGSTLKPPATDVISTGGNFISNLLGQFQSTPIGMQQGTGGALDSIVPNNALLIGTLVGKLGSLGTATAPAVEGGAGQYATNTKSLETTKTWLQKIFTRTTQVTTTNAEGVSVTKTVATSSTLGGTALAAVTGPASIMAMIGSYPFAGFIKEEALQTLGFAVNSATRNGDIEGAEEALAFQKEILEPNVWNQIIDKIPYVNVINQLKDFYKAAQIKNEVDEWVIEDMKVKQATGMTEGEMYVLRAEQVQAIKDGGVTFFNDERIRTDKVLHELDVQQQKETDRNQIAQTAKIIKLWEEYKERLFKRQQEEREKAAAFWLEYNRRKTSGGGLNFGLL